MFWAAHGLHCEVQQASYPGPIGLGNLLNSSRDRDRLLQLLVFNEEFLVNASHQLALITSLPFVHTARRSYRLDESMSLLESGRETTSVVERLLKIMQICSSRGRRSRNKVSVGEPAEGSLTQKQSKNQRTLGSPLGVGQDPVGVHLKNWDFFSSPLPTAQACGDGVSDLNANTLWLKSIRRLASEHTNIHAS